MCGCGGRVHSHALGLFSARTASASNNDCKARFNLRSQTRPTSTGFAPVYSRNPLTGVRPQHQRPARTGLWIVALFGDAVPNRVDGIRGTTTMDTIANATFRSMFFFRHENRYEVRLIQIQKDFLPCIGHLNAKTLHHRMSGLAGRAT